MESIGVTLHTPPASAAAFQELHHRFMIAYCTSKERELEILDGLDKVRAWAVQHSPEVRNAYSWAISAVKQQIAGQVLRAQHQARVEAYRITLPRPPEDAR